MCRSIWANWNVDGHCAFINNEKGWKVSLDDEQLSRLQPVTEDIKEILFYADYVLPMSMGNLPEVNGVEGYKETGLNWNE